MTRVICGVTVLASSRPERYAVRGSSRGRWLPSAAVSVAAPRPAFTLLEVLLVLALLAAVAAMSAPVLTRTLDARRLRSAADEVRTEWARTRNRAMESGRTFVFRYQPASNVYTVQPWSAEEDYLESSDLTALGLGTPVPGQTALPGADPLSTATTTRQLPERVTFAGSETVLDVRAELQTQEAAMAGAIDEQWSAPIFFYADGTASTARLALANERQQHILLSMRGLTGVVHVSDFLGAEEIP